ncbi:unnamed protein product [Lactuca virosa]|uniref:Uncharacterized protein n=1 Tax=Lactuca virosa TaxID=75947 RepID=A0AAU9PHG9_9ASTR|nr:unnamed protein product [Lactuca virosa]
MDYKIDNRELLVVAILNACYRGSVLVISDLFQNLTRVISSCINFKFTVSDRATDKFDKLPKRSLHLR